MNWLNDVKTKSTKDNQLVVGLCLRTFLSADVGMMLSISNPFPIKTYPDRNNLVSLEFGSSARQDSDVRIYITRYIEIVQSTWRYGTAVDMRNSQKRKGFQDALLDWFLPKRFQAIFPTSFQTGFKAKTIMRVWCLRVREQFHSMYGDSLLTEYYGAFWVMLGTMKINPKTCTVRYYFIKEIWVGEVW